MAATVVLAACGRTSGEGDTASLSRPGGTEAPTFAAPVTTTTTPPAVVEIAPPGAGATPPPVPTTAAATPPAAGTPGVVAPLTPAPPGTYRYSTVGTTQFNLTTTPFPPITRLVVDPPNGTRQHAARDLRDPANNGLLFESVLDYRRDGVYLVELKVSTTVVLVTDVQQVRPSPPQLLLPTDAAPGYHRAFDDGGIGVTVDVLRPERVTVGGRSYDTTVVQMKATALGEGNASMELTLWLDPQTGLWVKERSVASAGSPDRGFTYRSEYNATLLP